MAAGNTYVAIASQTLVSATASVNFTSISGAYTDLVLICSTTSATANGEVLLRFNGDATSNYSCTYLDGNGSAAGSFRNSTQTGADLTYNAGSVTTNPNVVRTNIMNYANTTTYKTALTRIDSATQGLDATISLWRSTAAITSVNVYSTSNFAIGSTFSLYGILAA